MSYEPKVGTVGWVDISSDRCEELRDFYAHVIGWKSEAVDCGDFDDYNMIPPEGSDPAAGVCHKTAVTPDCDPMWMVYFTVADLDKSLEQVKARGGEVLTKKHAYGSGGFAFIRDPAGAICALFQS